MYFITIAAATAILHHLSVGDALDNVKCKLAHERGR